MSTDGAKAIRQELKARHGWTARQVSVRGRSGEITVRIKDAAVSESAVRTIANRHEHVRHDQATGCILRGGNTFVSISWEPAVLDEIASRLPLDRVEPGDPATNRSPVTRAGRVEVWRSPDHMDEWRWSILPAPGQDWEEHHDAVWQLEEALGGHSMFRCWDRESCGRQIARAILHLGIDLDREPAQRAA